MHGLNYNKDNSVRATVVYEPFLFTRKIEMVSEQLERVCRKLTKPVYFISLMNEVTMIDRLLCLTPMIRIIMLFCIFSEDKLFQTLKVDEEGRAVDEAKIRQVFFLVESTVFLDKLRGLNELPRQLDAAERVATESS